MGWSKYQTAFYDAVQNTKDNLLLIACAGGGKTTVLTHAAKYLDSSKRHLAVAFNKAIAGELGEKLPFHVKASTMHSLGMKAVRQSRGGQIKVSVNKSIFLSNNIDLGTFGDNKEKFLYQVRLKEIIDYARVTLTEATEENFQALSNIYGIMIKKNEKDLIKHAVELYHYLDNYNKKPHKTFYMDFTDMLYLPYKYNYDLPKYDTLLVDEVQDLNNLQHAIVERMLGRKGRLIAVGDPYQCQPTGTKVMLWDGTEKNIEDVEVGESVVSYDSVNRMGFTGRFQTEYERDRYSNTKITAKDSHTYKGNLFTVTTKEYVSRYTINHRCMVKYKDSDCYAVYLMKKGDCWRIGLVRFWNNKGYLGVSQRLLQEQGDAIWILSVYDDRFEAYKQEQFLSLKYNIPQLRFFDNKCGLWTQQSLDAFWTKCLIELNLESNAKSLLEFFDKDVRYPFCIKEEGKRRAKNQYIECRAVNLIPEVMLLGVFDEGNVKTVSYRKGEILKPVDTEFTLTITKESLKVFSLSVSKREMYVADKILTHNSVYGFAGANTNSIELLESKFNCKRMPLSISYRCGQVIIEHAKEINSTIEPFEENPPGIVRQGTVREIDIEDFVICRNKLPLFELYEQLIQNETPAKIIGEGDGSEYVRMIERYSDEEDWKGVVDQLNEELNDILAQLKADGIEIPAKHFKYQKHSENVRNVSSFLTRHKDVEKAIQAIRDVFLAKDGVTLMTAHKSKGLENDRVFVIKKFGGKKLIPSQWAESAEQLKQERNLDYVIRTRAKSELIYLEL